MGEVFLAHVTSLDRKVALKFLPEEMQQDSTARKRFLREAKELEISLTFQLQLAETFRIILMNLQQDAMIFLLQMDFVSSICQAPRALVDRMLIAETVGKIESPYRGEPIQFYGAA